MMDNFIGLSPSDIDISVKVLNSLLSNTYVLSVKVQNYHWNVKDPRFYMLHDLFSDQYKELIKAVDEIAERIRMLGKPVAASMSHYLKLCTIEEANETLQNGDLMLQSLAKDHHDMIDLLRHGIEQVGQTQDQGTLDFLIGRLQYHEKMAWMTTSHL